MTKFEQRLKHIGSLLLSEINDLKRTPEVVAEETDIDLQEIQSVIGGKAGVETCFRVIEKITDFYPLSFSQMWLDADDTDGGVVIMRAQDSKDSARIFSRPKFPSGDEPYYEYRDTAMSRLGPFKPEWISMLRVVDDVDPINPDVVYNKGHFMHQVTYFIGAVNFYWEEGGTKHCVPMEDGGSCYIRPFVPHSFASRDSSNPGLIIAVTYQGEVRRALAAFLQTPIPQIYGSSSEKGQTFWQNLRLQLEAESRSGAEFLAGLDLGKYSSALGDGSSCYEVPTGEEIRRMARELCVSTTELVGRSEADQNAVSILQPKDGVRGSFSDESFSSYRVRRLVRTRFQPWMKAMEFTIAGDDRDSPEMSHILHQYTYNCGPEAVEVERASGEKTVLEPGDSMYLAPKTSHRFISVDRDSESRVLVIRVAGGLSVSALSEFHGYAFEGRNRVFGESMRWF